MSCRYAWSRLFNLAKTYNKNLSAGDVQQLSCNVLLSALSIMPYDVSDAGHTEAELDLEKERSIRMATILGFKVVCTSCPTSLNLVPPRMSEMATVLGYRVVHTILPTCRKLNLPLPLWYLHH